MAIPSLFGSNDLEEIDLLCQRFFVLPVTEHLPGCLVRIGEIPFQIRLVDPDGNRVGKLAVTCFADQKGLLRLFAFRHITHDAADADPAILQIDRELCRPPETDP